MQEPGFPIIERVEQLEEEIKALTEGKKEVFAEAKGEGYDVKVLREILKLRKQDRDERDEQELLIDLYMRAIAEAEPGEGGSLKGQAGFPAGSSIRAFSFAGKVDRWEEIAAIDSSYK